MHLVRDEHRGWIAATKASACRSDASEMTVLHKPGGPPSFPLDETGRFESTGLFDGIEVFANRNALPRAFLVAKAEVIPNQEALFNRLRDPDFDPTAVALLEREPDLPLPTGEGNTGEAQVVERTSNRVTIDVSAESDAVLVLSDAWYPGWMAYIDGVPMEVVPAFYAFRSVIVPEGSHRVEFRYEPATFRYGLAVSVVALFATLLLSARWLWTMQKVKKHP